MKKKIRKITVDGYDYHWRAQYTRSEFQAGDAEGQVLVTVWVDKNNILLKEYIQNFDVQNYEVTPGYVEGMILGEIRKRKNLAEGQPVL